MCATKAQNEHHVVVASHEDCVCCKRFIYEYSGMFSPPSSTQLFLRRQKVFNTHTHTRPFIRSQTPPGRTDTLRALPRLDRLLFTPRL